VALWVAGLTMAGVAIRFATLGLQSYHHDEVITAARVLPGSFGQMLHEVRVSESTPPLYYLIAWGWSKVFGLGEVGLRSLSALFGSATIPVAFLIGRELRGRRAALITAALAAFNPMLIWYSQEARAYSLLILLCAVSLLFLLRYLHHGRRRDLALWSISSALALISHYFAVFPLAVECAWLLALLPGRRLPPVLLGIAPLAAAGMAIAPLMLHQASLQHTSWIARDPILGRLWDTAVGFQIGETGKMIGERQQDALALVPGLLILAGLGALALRREGARRAAPALAVAIGGIVLALAAAAAGQDFVFDRNLLPALVPLLAAAAIGLAGLRRAGVILAAALCAYWLAFALDVDTTPGLQRPDWRAAAAQLGPARVPRAIVTWALGSAPLDYYLHDGTHRIIRGSPIRAREVDLISDSGAAPAAPPSPAFVLAGRESEDGLTVTRYLAPYPVGLRYRALRHMPTGFDSNYVMLGGPPAALPDLVIPLQQTVSVTPSQAKVQSLLPRKLKGIANATARACAGSALSPITATRTCSAARLISNAPVLTAKKRSASKPGWPSPGPNVQ
jgi:hypothetical protein